MNAEMWARVSAVFEAATLLEGAARTEFLTVAYENESAEVRAEVESLLATENASTEFLEVSALNEMARQVATTDEDGLNDLIGARCGNYRIVERLGAGGMGEVYLATDEKLERQVALKFLAPLQAAEPSFVARLTREARAASALNHPNILTVYEIGAADGRDYIAAEYVTGETLRARLKKGSPGWEMTRDIAAQVAAALVAAHTAGIVHRDIKPENIMLRADGYVKLLDFGLAKPVVKLHDGKLERRDDGMTESREKAGMREADTRTTARAKENNSTLILLSQHAASASSCPSDFPSRPSDQTALGVVIGTPRYMSPEQTRGQNLDARTDIWSLGVVIYEMLAGTPPFDGTTTQEIFRAIQNAAPPPLARTSIALGWQHIIEKCLAKESSARYADAQELLDELKALNFASPVVGKKRRTVAVAAIALLLLSALGFGVRQYFGARSSRANENTPAGVGAPTQNTKLFWTMSADEQTAFVRDAYLRVARMLGANPPALSDAELTLIKRQVDAYAATRDSLSTTPGSESRKTVYARASVYAPFIIDAFRARELPPVLGLYIAMIETEYHPCTESIFHGKGLFSFIPHTAERYGLQLAPQDERCDPHKIASAAAAYMNDLRGEFGADADSLTLALLGYNRGEGLVREDVARLKELGTPRLNFWEVRAHNAELKTKQSGENLSYVPRFFAAAIIGENPQNFGLEIKPLSSYGRK